MNYMLVPEQALNDVEQDLKRLAASGTETYSVDLNDEVYGGAFQRYLLFSRWPSLVATKGFHLSNEEVLYNSYYWMLTFSKLHASKHGYDAGIEQQLFKVLEQATCDVDWAIVEQLTNIVEKEVGQRK